MLARGMTAEPSVAVLQALHDHAEQLITRLAGPDQAREAKLRLAGGAAQLLGSAEPGSDHQLAWIQLLSWTATAEEQLDLIEEFLTAMPRDPALARMLRDHQDAVRRALNSRALTSVRLLSRPLSDNQRRARTHVAAIKTADQPPVTGGGSRWGSGSGFRDRQARTDQRERPDRIEPMLMAEPIDSTEATEPAEPTDKIEPADPIDRIEPADPMDKMDPLEPILRIDPAEPIGGREPSPVRMAHRCTQRRATPRAAIR